jgi:hypothetical protein
MIPVDFDKNSLILTFIFTSLLFSGIITSLYIYYKISNSFYKYLTLAGSIPMVAVLLLGYLLSPQKIVFENDKLKIDRIISDVYIDYSEIKEINIVNSQEVFLNAKRISASGGFWGYYGKFKSEKLGVYYLYARRDKGDYVIIKTNEKIYILAPSNIDAFVKKLKEKCKL